MSDLMRQRSDVAVLMIGVDVVDPDDRVIDLSGLLIINVVGDPSMPVIRKGLHRDEHVAKSSLALLLGSEKEIGVIIDAQIRAVATKTLTHSSVPRIDRLLQVVSSDCLVAHDAPQTLVVVVSWSKVVPALSRGHETHHLPVGLSDWCSLMLDDGVNKDRDDNEGQCHPDPDVRLTNYLLPVYRHVLRLSLCLESSGLDRGCQVPGV